MTTRPPRLATFLVQLALPTTVTEALLGDLHQEYATMVARDGVRRAGRWYWREAFRATVSFSRFREPDAPGPVAQGVGANWNAFADVRYAIRSLIKRPGFTAIATITLALGIGATTAIFSAVNPILFEPLPYPHPDRVTMIWEQGGDGQKTNVGFATYADLNERNRTFTSMAAVGGWNPTLTERGAPELLTGQRVSQSYFRVLGVAPAIGRDFRTEEDVVGVARVVVLSNDFWRTRFNADSSIVGRTITLNGNSITVIGVMPAGFQNVLNPQAQIWTPLRYGPSLPYACRSCRHLRVVGRMREGIGPEAARRDLEAVQRAIVAEHPGDYSGPGILTIALKDDLTSGVRPALLAVLGAVALVLLVACANVINLLLGRGAQRRGEFAVRAALGAGRARLIRQVLTESIVLSLIGGVGGTLIAIVGTRLLFALSPANLPRHEAIQPSATLLLFSFGLTLVVGLVAGVIPALHATRTDLGDGIKLAGRRSAGGTRFTRGGLVVAEVALALILLTGCGLMLRSVTRLLAVSPGFKPDHLLTMQLQATSKRFTNDTVTRAYFDAALDAVRAVPGVESAGVTSQLPLSGDFDAYGIHTEVPLSTNPADDLSAFRYAVSPGYLESMGIALRRGRTLLPSDRLGAPSVAIVNASFGRKFFPGLDPMGKRFHVGDTTGPWYTVVGVVDDVKQGSLASPQADGVYLPESQWIFADGSMSLVVRTKGDPETMVDAVRNAVWSVDRDEPIVRVATMNQLLENTAAERRFVMLLFEGFAIVALVLAAAGIYGVLSSNVTDRLREIGVRSALGASRRNILGLVIREGLGLTLLGIAVGLAGAAAASQAIASLLFGLSRLDLMTYTGVAVVLLAVSGLACSLPAWRAARVDPAITLRAD